MIGVTFTKFSLTACIFILQVESKLVNLKEDGVELKLTVLDVPGFGDAVDNTDCWLPISEFIEKQYDEYLDAESGLQRSTKIPDKRVHCLLYFIAPNGRG